MVEMQFTIESMGEHTWNVLSNTNTKKSNEPHIVAEILIPEDEEVSESYGYFDLKKAVIAACDESGIDTAELSFWYSAESENHLADDASTGNLVWVGIETEDETGDEEFHSFIFEGLTA